MLRQFAVVFFVIVMLPTTLGLAREWTDSTGKLKVDAQFIDANDVNVRLKRVSDGRVFTIPIAEGSTQRHFRLTNGGTLDGSRVETTMRLTNRPALSC